MKSTFVFVICFVIFFNYCPAQKIHFCDTTNRWVTSGYDSFNSRSVITYYKPSCCDTPFEWPVYSYTDIDVMEYDGTFEYGGTFLDNKIKLIDVIQYLTSSFLESML